MRTGERAAPVGIKRQGERRIRYARLAETDRAKRAREADKEGGRKMIKGAKGGDREKGKGEREKVNYRFHDKRFARSNRRGITGRT